MWQRALCLVRVRSEARTRMSATNIVGLVLVVAITIFMIIALMFPERF